MGAQSVDPFCPIRVDCRSVQQGAQQDAAWAGASHRRFARAWCPLIAVLEGDARRVTWMPAHCGVAGVGRKRLDDGSCLTADDVHGNEVVDAYAKQAARRDCAPWHQVQAVRRDGRRLRALATWIGRLTAAANSFPDPAGGHGRIRDAEARACHSAGHERPAKRQAAHLDAPPPEGAGRRGRRRAWLPCGSGSLSASLPRQLLAPLVPR